MIRFQDPRLPSTSEVAAYFGRSEAIHWYTNGGPCHKLLVERLEARLSDPPLRCVPLSNATLALMLGIRALTSSRGKGADEVLIPSFTFAAVVSAVLWAGLRPVFIDVEPDSWHLSPAALEDALLAREGRVALVLACSTFGFPPPSGVRTRWTMAASAAGVPLLVDSAAGFGAVSDDGQILGGQGDAEVFSLHATKPFAIGEGGLLTTSSPDVADRVGRLSNFGFLDGVVEHEVGLNAKLAEWPAAVALAVLDRYDGVLATRRQSAAALLSALTPLGYSGQQGADEGAWQFVPVMASSASVRDAVLAESLRRGIEIRTYYRPLHLMPAFRDVECHGEMDTTTDLARRTLSLPMSNDLAEDARATIVDCLTTAATERGGF